MSWAPFILAALLIGANAWLVFAREAETVEGSWRKSLGGTLNFAALLLINLSNGWPAGLAQRAFTMIVALAFVAFAVRALLDVRKAREAAP